MELAERLALNLTALGFVALGAATALEWYRYRGRAQAMLALVAGLPRSRCRARSCPGPVPPIGRCRHRHRNRHHPCFPGFGLFRAPFPRRVPPLEPARAAGGKRAAGCVMRGRGRGRHGPCARRPKRHHGLGGWSSFWRGPSSPLSRSSGSGWRAGVCRASRRLACGPSASVLPA